jgi:predicted NUDIX family phosphoesterase
MPTDERVLVIPEAHFHRAGFFRGFRPADDEYRAALLSTATFSFRPRRDVETDPTVKQLIPYVVLRCGDRLFHYRRGRAGTETRLAALRSVGVGGHISEADAAGEGSVYRTGMLRELAEEVTIGCPYAEQGYGFIYDDSTPVGSVHLGVVHLFELAEPSVEPRDAALAEARFSPLDELTREAGQFETWSQFVLKALTN